MNDRRAPSLRETNVLAERAGYIYHSEPGVRRFCFFCEWARFSFWRRTTEPLVGLVFLRRLGGTATAVRADVADESQVADMFE